MMKVAVIVDLSCMYVVVRIQMMRMFASIVEPIVMKYVMMQRTTWKIVKLVKQFEMSNWNELLN